MSDTPFLSVRFGGRYCRAGENAKFDLGPIAYRKIGCISLLTIWGKAIYRRVARVRAVGPLVVTR